MILWYAAGGGLGHITRAIAILKRLTLGGRDIRILATSRHAPLAAASSPYPLDCVPRELHASKQAYLAWLGTYVRDKRVTAVVLDTFPSGVIGEWNVVATSLPRILIARYLDLGRYAAKTGQNYQRPLRCLAIEEPHPMLCELMGKTSAIDRLNKPVIDEDRLPQASNGTAGWAVVHAGPDEEIAALTKHARHLMQKDGSSEDAIETITPGQNIYPAAPHLGRFGNIVTAAGYNSAALSLFAPRTVKFHMTAFDRPFDDQSLRLDRISRGEWVQPVPGGAEEAAGWMYDTLANY